MKEKDLMCSSLLYCSDDEELKIAMQKARKILQDINNSSYEALSYRNDLYKQLFQKIGSTFHIEPPFRCDYGFNIQIGDYFYANYDCIFLDVCLIEIGNNVFLGPRVSLFGASHPIDATIRNTLLEYGLPIKIGNSVWIGGNSVILGGVTIGDNTIVGAGSLVNKSLPANCVAGGNPCKVIRYLNDNDKLFWNEKAEAYKKNSTD